MYTSYQIGNYFIKKSQDSGGELTPMKLIKLTYIAHGWYLGLANKSLLDEVIQAWKYGPVIKTLYHDFKKYENCQITELYSELSGSTYYYPLPDSEINSFLDAIWKSYGKFDGIQLSAMTHQPNTPWDIVWNKQGGSRQNYAIIPNDLIKQHYLEKIRKTNGGNPATAQSEQTTAIPA
jgi:uncharacterized phage-associated protein